MPFKKKYLFLATLSPLMVLSEAKNAPSQEVPNNVISFSGYDWEIKETIDAEGPGPNYFYNSFDNIYRDSFGNLHLKIVKDGKFWKCSEVISKKQFGYGRYIFNIQSRVDLLDMNAVFGIFLWDPQPNQSYNHEMDIEVSRWGIPDNKNAQFVMQPNTVAGNMKRFNMPLNGNYSSFMIEWYPDRVFFSAYHGHLNCDNTTAYKNPKNTLIQSWSYKESPIPLPSQSNVRFNLWLNEGTAPATSKPQEVIISCFTFIPL